MQNDEMELLANRCRMELLNLGFELRLVRDISEMEVLFQDLEKKAGPAVDQRNLLLTEKNCFSVFCFEQGSPVMGFAVRIDDFGQEDAQSFLPRTIETVFGIDVTATLIRPYVGHRWGRAAYFGDLKSRNDRGLSRKALKVLQLSSVYAQYQAFERYGADTNYAFLRLQDARNAFLYGLYETGPYVWETNRTVFKDGNPGCVAWLSKERLPLLIAGASLLLPAHFSVQEKPRLEVVTKDSASGP